MIKRVRTLGLWRAHDFKGAYIGDSKFLSTDLGIRAELFMEGTEVTPFSSV